MSAKTTLDKTYHEDDWAVFNGACVKRSGIFGVTFDNALRRRLWIIEQVGMIRVQPLSSISESLLLD